DFLPVSPGFTAAPSFDHIHFFLLSGKLERDIQSSGFPDDLPYLIRPEDGKAGFRELDGEQTGRQICELISALRSRFGLALQTCCVFYGYDLHPRNAITLRIGDRTREIGA